MIHIQRAGLFVFLITLLVLMLGLSMNSYKLTEDSLHAAVGNQEHLEKMTPALEDIFNVEYSSKSDFISDYHRRFNSFNDELKKQEKWDEVIWTDYTFQIVKQSSMGFVSNNKMSFFIICFLISVFGALMYIIPERYKGEAGIKNDKIFFSSSMNRGWIGILLGIGLITFYIFIYKFPEYITNWVIMLDPLSIWMNGSEADQWFLYGFIYCLAMSVMGIRMLIKYRNNKYQLFRTSSVIFFQIAFAFTIPQILKRLNMPAYDLKSAWPLEYTFFFDYRLDEHLASGTLGIWMIVWGIALFAIGVPIFTYLYGKRWYCSWVCGCGGLAETLGDPYRQLSDKSVKAWKVERYLVHGVLVFAVIMTVSVLYTYFSGSSELLGISTYKIREQYGFFIGFAFAGVVGTGFYPLMGNRMWCRFGCPLAAYIGLIQRFKSRFRITTNGAQCISCGNCSTYCEMGIDVRWYAQRGQNIVRSSCVGCGICSAVCPRGVLKLENGPEKDRINDNPIVIGSDSAVLNV